AAARGIYTSGERLDAILALYQDLHNGPPTLAWALVDRNVEVMPSMGPAECGDTTALVDANSGSLLDEYQGAPVI
ncbi:MAG: hypothetical protein JO265_00305, partial [Acidimicrobiia bacterium]|nr:hypothetical protein [Acidimicrobiia bacterium]